MSDARTRFDDYMVRYSTWREIVEVLRYTYVYGHRCIGRVRQCVLTTGQRSKAVGK